MRVLYRVLLAAFVFAFSLSAFAKGAQYPVAKITITGGAPYSDAEILSIAVLKPGDVLTLDTLAGPAQRLLDTGMFDSAEMELIGPGNRTAHLSLKPVPADKLLPASLENFVWWTPEELTEAIHAKVPLYRGACADAGNLPNLVQAALEQMLAEKGIQAATSFAIAEATTQHPQRVMSFRLDRPSVRLQSVELTGIPSIVSPADVQAVNRRLIGGTYNEGLTRTTIEDQLLAPWRNLGFIHAQLNHVVRTPTSGPGGIVVAYTAQLQAGDIYKIGAVNWEATPLFSEADFERSLKLHPGDVATSKLLEAAERPILDVYLSQGYLNVYLTHTLVSDDATHTVGYSLHAVPGDQYRVRKLVALNLSPAAQQAFDAAWTMKSGDLYNDLYFRNFIFKNIAQQGALKGWTATYDLLPDNQEHVVDMTLSFVPPQGIRR